MWEYEGYDPAEERLRESLCTLGNGYFGSRGVLPECGADAVHYPGTYVAGCYNRLTSEVSGRRVENEDMVNVPNWLPLRFRLTGGAWLGPDTAPVLEHRQILHLGPGVLERRTRFDVGEGRVLAVRQQRLVHMGDPHLAALRTDFTVEGFSAELEVEALLDGGVTNDGVPRYRDLDGRHLTDVHAGTAAPDRVWLRCRTRTSDIHIAMASRVTVHAAPVHAAPAHAPAHGAHQALADHRALPTVRHEPSVARQVVRLGLTPGRTVTVDKTVALHTSYDPAISDPLYAAVHRVGRAPGFDALLGTHRTAWDQLWRRARLDVPGEAGRILRLHLFHVLQTLSPHTADLDVGVPARGLHGESYRGHVFW
ncbi:MAG TPA: glycoside hydrolase family 65 protein, partial [Streptomyces sp.]|nr:glycoside hydrolase family 65 protein [Streptomyces sp.]